MAAKTTVFIEAMSLAPEHMSGVGHLTAQLIKGLLADPSFNDKYQLKLVVPFNKAGKVRQKFTNQPIVFKKLWLPARGLELLARLRLLPPVDLFIGRGLYIFPNFKNWPLARSYSYTYVHDLSFIRYPQFAQAKNLAYLRRYLPGWIARSSHILTISEFSKSEIMDVFNVPAAKISVVYASVDGTVFKPQSLAAINNVKTKLGISTENYLVFVGNIEPRKNLQRLVEAFAKLPTAIKQNSSLLIIGGDGWSNQAINQTIAEVRATGAKIVQPKQYISDEDLPAIYAGATALVHPALYEGFGITLVEAMACGTAVAAADTGSIPEVTATAAKLFNPLDVDSIKDAMLEVVGNKNLRNSLKDKGLARAQAFDSHKTTRQLLKVLEDTAAGRG